MFGQALVALATGAVAFGAPSPARQERGLLPSSVATLLPAATPSAVVATEIAITIDPNIQRDSCVSADQLIDGRVFWICRDSLSLANETLGQYSAFFTSSSASWSNQTQGVTATGGIGNQPLLTPIPASQGQKYITNGFTQQLTQYGGPFPLPGPYLPYPADRCPDSGGGCGGGRFIEWPDASMYVTDVAADGTTTGYLFATAAEGGVNGTTDNTPGTTLYKIVHYPNQSANTLPNVTIVGELFFPRFGFNYGAMGGLISPDDGLLYLWGETYDFAGPFVVNPVYNQSIGLARVAPNAVENINAYQYYYPGTNTWSSVQPTIFDSSANITVGGIYGQGTFYYNTNHNVYTYVGQNTAGAMNVAYSVATKPEGPWSPASPNTQLGTAYSYSLAAHPQMGNDPDHLYVTFTANLNDPSVGNVYQEPLYLLDFDFSGLSSVLAALESAL